MPSGSTTLHRRVPTSAASSGSASRRPQNNVPLKYNLSHNVNYNVKMKVNYNAPIVDITSHHETEINQRVSPIQITRNILSKQLKSTCKAKKHVYKHCLPLKESQAAS
jgi:hypothetical protein